MKNELLKTNIQEFSGINYLKTADGEILLSLKDIAIGLGFEKEENRNGKITKSIRWNRVKQYLAQIDDKYLRPEVVADLFISESDFYELSMMAQSEVAKAFRKKIAREILPAIRKTGGYISEDITPEQAENLLENQIILFYKEGGEKAAQRIRALIESKNFDSLDLWKSFQYIYGNLSSSLKKAFIKSFSYAVEESYDRALCGNDKKKKRLANEGLRTKSELMYRIECAHHQWDNRSYGQKLRHAKSSREQ